MASSHVQIAPDSTGKDIGTVRLTSDEAGTPAVERQEVVVASPTTFANRQEVDSSGNAQVKLNAPLPAGSNAIGSVSVSNLPSTQPVSGSVAVSSLPGSPAQDGTDATGVSAPTGGVGIRGWLSGIYQRLGGTLATSRTWTLGSGTDSVDIGNFPGTQPISGAVSVSNLPATQPVSGTVTTNDGGTPLTGQSLPTGSGITGWLSRLYVALTGTLTTNATIQGTPTVSVSNLPATQPVSGTVTTNDGGTAITGQSLQAGGAGVLGWLSQIYKALSGTLTISGAVTNSNLDVALSTRLKPADTLAGVTTVAAVTAITNPLPAGTNSIGQVTANAGTGVYKNAQQGGATLTAAQVSVTSSGVQIIAVNASRYSVVIKNTGAAAVYLGPTGVTTSTGHYLGPNESISFRSTAAIYGIVTSTSMTVTTLEESV